MNIFSNFKNSIPTPAGPRGGKLDLTAEVEGDNTFLLFHGSRIVSHTKGAWVAINPAGWSHSPTTLKHIIEGLSYLGYTLPENFLDNGWTYLTRGNVGYADWNHTAPLRDTPPAHKIKDRSFAPIGARICSITPTREGRILVKARHQGVIYSAQVAV